MTDSSLFSASLSCPAFSSMSLEGHDYPEHSAFSVHRVVDELDRPVRSVSYSDGEGYTEGETSTATESTAP